MKILYFGDFDPEYARNRVLIKGLRENGVEVFLCNVRLNNLKKYWHLWMQSRQYKEFDVLIVGHSDNRFMVPLAKLCFGRKKIVWDAFYSIYDSWVFDRKLVSQTNPKAFYYWFLEWLNCKLADTILTDTNQHIDYFTKEFRIPRSKCIKALVGADDEIFEPLPAIKNGVLRVLFWGFYIPLQGVQYIVRAAEILKNHKDILFEFVGDGQTHSTTVRQVDDLGLSNIVLTERLSINELSKKMVGADICLGIFGETPKAQRVIPNKAYAAIAVAKPLISADTPAMRELFTDRKDVLLCCSANGEDLAQKILELKENKLLRSQIAQSGRQLYAREATPRIIGQYLIRDLTKLLYVQKN